MSIRPATCRTSEVGMRRRVCTTRLYGLAIACVLIGSMTATGCRGDRSRRSEPSSFGPMSWFRKQDDAPSSSGGAPRPRERRNATTPPVPPPAPVPEPSRSIDAGDFYGVRRTTAENADDSPQRNAGLRTAFGSKPQQSQGPQVYWGGDAAPLLRPVPGSR